MSKKNPPPKRWKGVFSDNEHYVKQTWDSGFCTIEELIGMVLYEITQRFLIRLH